MCDLTVHGQNTVTRILRTIAETSVPSSNGGYVTEFGPVTWVDILDVLEVLDPPTYTRIIERIIDERKRANESF